QVLHDTWSVVLHTDAETFCVTVAPFQGVQTPPYNGNPRVDARDLFYDSRGWWKHAHALRANAPVGPGRLHRLSRGLSASGLPSGAGSLNEALGGDGRDEAPGSERGGPGGERGTLPAGLPGPSLDPETPQLLVSSTSTDDNPNASTSPPSTTAAAISRGSGVTTLTPMASSAPAPLHCPDPKGVVGIFSAEGSWDPAFVMAPGRLVALQNKEAARRRGVRRARQVAWHRIDGPEARDAMYQRGGGGGEGASVAPRPMMPRCFSFTTTTTDGGGRTCAPVRSSTSIPGLGRSKKSGEPGRDPLSPSKRTTAVAPYHGGGRSHTTRQGSASVSRSLSPPPMPPMPRTAGGGSSSATAGGGQASAVDAWLELQKEMGSLKADNRLCSRGSSRNGCGGGG
ncbi:unnamed protein product, partial [Laminaria digitata]